MRKSTSITVAAMFAALYATITILETALGGPISFGPIQVRVSDALLPLAMVFGYPAAIGALFGTVLANAYTGLGLIDVVFGSLANLVACILSAKFNRGNTILATLYPVIVVTAVVGSYLPIYFPSVPLWSLYAGVAVGEIISCIVLGLPLLLSVRRIWGRSGRVETRKIDS